MGQQPLPEQQCGRLGLVRVLLTVCTLLLGVSVAAGAAPVGGSDSDLGDSSDSVVATSLVYVRPVDDEGRLKDGFRVTKSKQHASCGDPMGVASKLVDGALSCARGLVTWDPCWSEKGGSRPSVICMTAPWKRRVVRLFTSLEVTPPSLVEPDVNSETGTPWGVELENGDRCLFFAGGARGWVDDDPIYYYCRPDKQRLVLLGTMDRSSPAWTTRAARYVDEEPGSAKRVVEDKTIVIAWFGAQSGSIS